jgi:hypothetical protein
MTQERYWVVGGEYSCMAFKALKDGAPHVLGPFEDRDEAKEAWKRVSQATRANATTRYSIAAEQFVLPA